MDPRKNNYKDMPPLTQSNSGDNKISKWHVDYLQRLNQLTQINDDQVLDTVPTEEN